MADPVSTIPLLPESPLGPLSPLDIKSTVVTNLSSLLITVKLLTWLMMVNQDPVDHLLYARGVLQN